MTVSVIFTSIEIYNGVLSVADGIIPLTSQAVPSATQLFAGVDAKTVTSASSMNDIEFSKFVIDASTITSIAVISSVEGGASYFDGSTATSTASILSVQQANLIDANTIISVQGISTFELAAYIDAATRTSVAVISSFEGNVNTDLDTITSTSIISSSDAYTSLDVNQVASISVITTGEAMIFDDETSVVTAQAVISSQENYNAQNIYTDANTVTSVAVQTSIDGKFFTDAATMTAIAAPSSQGILPGQFIQVVGTNTGGQGQLSTIAIPAPSGGSPAGHTLIFAAISTTQPLTSISDTQGNTWTVDKTLTVGTEFTLSIGSSYLTHSLISSDTITGTYSLTIAGRAAICVEYSGFLSSSFIDTSVFATNTLLAVQNLTVTGAANSSALSELIIGLFGFGGTPTVTAGAKYTLRGSAQATINAREIVYEDLITNFPGAQSASVTWGSNQDVGGIIAAYKAFDPSSDSKTTTDTSTMTAFGVVQSTDTHLYPADSATITAVSALSTTDQFNALDAATETSVAQLITAEGKAYVDAATETEVTVPSATEVFEGFGLYDDFNRTPVTSGWGTPIRGNAWAINNGGVTHFYTDGAFAYINLTTLNSSHNIYTTLDDPQVSSNAAEGKYNIGFLLKAQWSLNTTGAFDEPMGMMFWLDPTTGDHVRLRIRQNPDSTIQMGLDTLTGTNAALTHIVNLFQILSTSSANTDYWLRGEAKGLDVGNVNVKARFWQDGTTEPSTWNINSSFTTPLPPLTANYAVRLFRSSSSTSSPLVKFSYAAMYYLST